METGPDSLDPLTSLIGVAVHSDDSARLVSTASLLARQPLALVGQHGEPLGHAPEGAEGRRALAVASAAVHNRLVDAAGWRIVPVVRGTSSLGFLAIGRPTEPDAAATRVVLDVLPELVAEQLQRVALMRAQRRAFVRRLLSDRRFGAADARGEARDLGMDLAEAYWPAILTWHGVTPPGSVVDDLARDASSLAEGSLAAVLSRRIVLLHPSPQPGDGDDRPLEWMREVVRQARALAPSFPAQAIVAEAAVELGAVSTGVAELDALRRLGPRVEGERLVVSAREYALECLLWKHLDASVAGAFVREQLEPLIDWDREHRTDLLSVLEAELDFPRHDQAARSCFMHRNTFRHRVHQAREVLGDTLEDPDVRLAVHVALKLRRLLSRPSLDDGATSRRYV